MIPFGIGTAVLLFVVMAYSLIDSFGGDQVRPTAGNPTQEISDAIFSTYLLPFELVSLLLLAALVGAIVLARKE
jgi:NADH-quinone oxidoreductase subunit J